MLLWTLLGISLLVGGISVAADIRTLIELRRLVPPGHYLVLLQNNAELRPSGGFIGTFATVDVTQSGYQNLVIDTNIYKRDNALTDRITVTPPEPLIPMTGGKWAMRDSNWDPDFATAAEQVAWFYQQEGGESVDGVVAVNATVIADLLKLTGPITIPGIEEALTSETFFDTLHYQIEKGYFIDEANERQNEPKTIVKDLFSELRDRLAQPHVLVRLSAFLEAELKQKQILLFHTDPAIQRQIVAHRWGGTLQTADANSLALVSANLTGKKSSLNIRQAVDLTIEPGETVDRHRLEMTRTHTGTGVWPDFRNNNYTRVLVPLDATLVEVTRATEDITEDAALGVEANRTSIGFWLNTDPQTTSSATIVYDVPHHSPYRLAYQKQSGVLVEHVRVTYSGAVLFDRDVTTDVIID